MAGGGGYLDNGGAGVFHLEVMPCTDTSYQYITIGQMSIKALSKTPQLKLTITNSNSSSYGITYTPEADNSADILIDVSADAIPTYQTIVTALDADGTVGPIIDATVSEGVGADTISTQAQTSFTTINSSPKRSDVGFRCVVPLSESTFEVTTP